MSRVEGAEQESRVDWDKIINTVAEVARKAFTLALCAILILVAVAGTYIALLTLWWVVQWVRKAVGA